MKNKKTILLSLSFLAAAWMLSGCLRDECTSSHTFIRFDPVFKTLAECREGITVEAPRDLRHPGKIYVLGNLLFINEQKEGIHVLDNTNPASPQKIAFWSIPGNVDMAIRDQKLYADQYLDLLTFDISDLQNPQLLCRTENVFPLFGTDGSGNVIVDYTQTEVTEELPCRDPRWNSPWFEANGVFFVNDATIKSGTGQTGTGSGSQALSGIAGSYARFGLYDNYLYTVDNSNLRTYSVSSACPVSTGDIAIGWNIETIFPWKNKLFIGSQTGVFIFDNSNPQQPVLETRFDHASGCDPVVCDDKFAYVTIHDGTTCNGTFNQLDIIGIEQLPGASLVKSIQMTKPFGLSVNDKNLFVCDDGLKIYDKSAAPELKEVSHLKGFSAYDAIALGDSRLILIGSDGFYQFDVTDPSSPKQISLIPVIK